jgi:hypothetical protein
VTPLDGTLQYIFVDSTDRLPPPDCHLVVESRRNGQNFVELFGGITWWNQWSSPAPPARPPVAAPPHPLPRALGSGHPAPHRGALFATRSLCFPAAGQRPESRPFGAAFSASSMDNPRYRIPCQLLRRFFSLRERRSFGRPRAPLVLPVRTPTGTESNPTPLGPQPLPGRPGPERGASRGQQKSGISCSGRVPR